MPGVPGGNLGYRLGSSLPLGRASLPVRLATANLWWATRPVPGTAGVARKRVPGKVLLLPQVQALPVVFPCPEPVQACLAGALAWQLPFPWGRHWGSHGLPESRCRARFGHALGQELNLLFPGGARDVTAKVPGLGFLPLTLKGWRALQGGRSLLMAFKQPQLNLGCTWRVLGRSLSARTSLGLSRGGNEPSARL